jgi:molybdopterin-guanine dinucleotide biosynthesis protein A
MTGDTTPARKPAVSAIVLAGGKSSRFGKDKAFLLLDGQPLVARTVHQLAALSDDLIVVTNDLERYEPLDLPARLLPDERPGEGSLMGIYSGLKAARHSHALAVGCDMPFLSLPLLQYMLPLTDGYDVVIPRPAGMLEPLHALYGKACLPAMARLLEQGRRQIIAFFHEVRVRYVEEGEIDRFDPHHRSLLNVNTTEDWDLVQRLFTGHTRQ